MPSIPLRSRGVRGIIVAAAALNCSFAPFAFAEAPFCDLAYDAALAEAKKADKLVMIDFYTTWCPPCKMLDKLTWPNAKVQEWLKANVVAIKVDAEKNRDLSAKFAVHAYPTLLFVKPDGSESNRIVGYHDPDGFIRAADAIRKGTAPPAARPTPQPQRIDPEKDPMSRYKRGQQLEREGKAAEALAEYLWCYDHGLEASRAFYGVRLSFLINSIAGLGKTDPAAVKALQERRDTAEKELLAAWAKPQSVHEVVTLNKALSQEPRSLKIYDALAKQGESSAAVRKLMTPALLDQLLAAKRYDDIVNSSDDIAGEVDERIGRYEQVAVYMSQGAKPAGGDSARTEAQRRVKRDLLSECGKYYEALLGAGKTDKAAEVADRLLELDASKDTTQLLADAATRAGKEDVAKTWQARAEAGK